MEYFPGGSEFQVASTLNLSGITTEFGAVTIFDIGTAFCRMFRIYNDAVATVSWAPACFLCLHAPVCRLFADAVSTADAVRHQIISEDNVWEEVAAAHCRGILLREWKTSLSLESDTSETC
jgi:hypothetical protein